jgi:preprotein translocase subunit SecE
MAKEKVTEKEKKEKAKKVSAKAKAPSKQKKKAGSYFKEVVEEMKRVTWPNRQEVYQSTLLVLAVVGFFILYVGIVDQILIQLIKLMTSSITGGQ